MPFVTKPSNFDLKKKKRLINNYMLQRILNADIQKRISELLMSSVFLLASLAEQNSHYITSIHLVPFANLGLEEHNSMAPG